MEAPLPQVDSGSLPPRKLPKVDVTLPIDKPDETPSVMIGRTFLQRG